MSDSDRTNLQNLAESLLSAGFYAYVRSDAGVPLLFALGAKKAHSVDFRRTDRGLVIEYWRGHPDDDFISDQVVKSFGEAVPLIRGWLSRDAA